MKFEILGTGCRKCKKLFAVVEKVVKDKGLDAELIKVEDINDIAEFGVMKTPALAIDGEIVLVGKVPSAEEVVELIEKR